MADALALPTNLNKRDDIDAHIIKRKKTITSTSTHYETVNIPRQTYTNTLVATKTSTVTRYTATITSTVYGPVSIAAAQNNQNEVQNSDPTSQAQEVASSSSYYDTPEPTPEPSSSALAQPAPISSSAPTTTSAPEVTGPTSNDSWVVENVTTVTSDGVCYVNYDYYYDSDTVDEETITLTSTISVTITQM